ncbi:ribonuclease E/G [Mesorhizobium sp. KR1-2]|uniref:Rne/Rng family ribonuclease n=1 Tax=Mesorhizobium sp. KR1-2 TaxID=3156609 RepID=UPI0032B58E67
MPNKMLVDASHPEETRVVVVRGNRIEEFDFESQDKKQLKGNIYLARVTRVEPSLQAAFVEYGGNRHGFLAFSEIHPDYYQIPVADRQALLRAEAEEHEDEDEDGNGNGDGEERQERNRGRKRRRGGKNRGRGGDEQRLSADSSEEGATASASDDETEEHDEHAGEEASEAEAPREDVVAGGETAQDATTQEENDSDEASESGPTSIAAAVDADVVSEPAGEAIAAERASDKEATSSEDEHRGVIEEVAGSHDDDHGIEVVGAEDAMEEMRSRRKPMRRHYKIQEVIKRRQILLVQVVKEERGNKGAALTTYLSLAGRYSVLMPNTARGGGISRKITNAQDRKRLKEVVQELEVPQGMGVILRTAGESRTKAEIKRDYEYLMRMWENVRSLTLQSVAPALVYEEGSLIKRSVRDLYNKDIDEILVAGEEGYREAKDFMRMLMPSHAKVVQPYRDTTPIFARNGIEAQLDRMLQPQVTLKSGGYIIINQTEALVAIDVNSGRSTKEHSIEDTALQTNLEAAEEVARQLRLRDLAGLIVIDFIDMEENRNNRAVEKRLKDHLKNDRARIQVGRISHFGLMEMSRQRIRASVLESTMKPCPHCGGTGHVRSDSSVALLVVRAIEEFLLKDSRHHITVRTPAATAFYVLNHKRSTLVEMEQRFGLTISMEPDDSIGSQHYAISRGAVVEKPVVPQPVLPAPIYIEDEEIEEEVIEAEEAETAQAEEQPAHAEKAEEGDHRDRKRRKRRRRRGGKDRDREQAAPTEAGTVSEEAAGGEEEEAIGEQTEAEAASAGDGDEAERKKRRRGKRGGRRNRKEDGEAGLTDEAPSTEAGEGEEAEEGNVAAPAAEMIEPATEAVVVEIAPAEEAAVEEASAEKPKKAPRRASRSKKAVAEEAAVTESVAAEAEAAPAEEKPAKKPRASRRKTAEPAPAPAAETAPEAPAEAEAAAVEVEPAAPAAEPQPVAPEPEPVAAEEPQQDDKPKKVGWWQRKSFF